MSGEIVVIGGGAAGMMAAITAARRGGQVTLLEPNERLGKKVNITGKGRCNVTNDCDAREFISAIPGDGRLVLHCHLHGFAVHFYRYGVAVTPCVG